MITLLALVLITFSSFGQVLDLLNDACEGLLKHIVTSDVAPSPL